MRNLMAVTALSMLATACGVETDETNGADDVAAIEGDLSASSLSYNTVRRDFRRCMAPLCGGWWVKTVNSRAAEQYVSGFDFSQSRFDQATQDLISGSGDQLVLRAKLSSAERRFKTRRLIITEAWRGMPGVTATASHSFYSVKDMRPLVRCIAAPCNAVQARKLGTSSVRSVTGIDVTAASMPFVQDNWLENRITQHEGLVAANIVQGQQFPAGRELILAASNVFVKLPESIGPCPQMRLAPCARGQVWTFTRDEERCVLPIACEEQRMCTLSIPACEEGYSLRSWTGAGGCAAYACDPTWSLPAEQQ